MPSIPVLTPSETKQFIVNVLLAGGVPYIAGPAAIGKSQVCHSVAVDFNAVLIDLRLSQMLSEDLTGYPEKDPKTGKAYYIPFDVFPLEGDPLPDSKDGWILFLDELSSASEEVMAACYKLILDRMVGNRKLHPKCLIVAAGNRASDSAIARELPDTLITRMLCAEMKTSAEDWLKWAKAKALPGSDPIITFIEKNKSMLYVPVAQKDKKELESYPNPRSWERMCSVMNLHESRVEEEAEEETDSAGIPVEKEKQNISKPLSQDIFELFISGIGAVAAQAFKDEYDEAIQLPYPWEIAQSPKSIRIPSSGVGKSKVIDDVATYFLKGDDGTREGILTYVNRFPGDFKELFTNNITNGLGDSISDKKLIQKINDRLGIDELLGTSGGLGSNPDVPF